MRCIHIALHVRKRFMRVEAIAFVNFSVYNICIALRYVLMLKNHNKMRLAFFGCVWYNFKMNRWSYYVF